GGFVAGFGEGFPGQSLVAQIVIGRSRCRERNQTRHRGQRIRVRDFGRRSRGRPARNAMVGDLGVCNIRAGIGGHVTFCAVRLIGMMLLAKRRAMAGETLSTIERGALLGRRRAMRIVTTDARHGVARLLLASALSQGLELAVGAQSRRRLVGRDVVADVVGEVVAGAKLVQMLAGSLDGGVALEMTLHADGVAAVRRELGGIDDCATAGSVRSSLAVTTFATDAGLRK